ncbi:thiamine/thiamine pyrophosphate ABC transporter permease ThiP [Shimia thalassica]|uniref:thiamine/thiamine pyrophosphate ABC transporter permease ThiP n=1 Tax=Shimia thalassica TaxID=1715693 RepID=UPI0026E343A1|nr:thiamine/thiamine pyrophosphate ABC transporter permease ThiP [Shimia thalassica]MDO6485031.1 thiamine/thiamine pyrophosphate ABC transporter permease ThiP [Shimia thalassica]
MAGRVIAIRAWPGIGAAAFVAALILGTLLAVALRAEAGRGLGPSEWAALRFTVSQALWSAGLSVLLAIPVARALARRRFIGRRLFISLLGAPFILPVIVAVLGLLAVFGRSGIVNLALRWAELPEISIYGFHGVVLAHVFFNLPLATRLILQGWQQVPAERFRLAAQLGFGSKDMWRIIEAPMLRRVVPQSFAVIFALCISSFAVALTLGGGPKATTVELAIYQAFRFDFDLGRAALLSCLQLVMVGAAALLALKLSDRDGFGAGLDRPVLRWDADTAPKVALDTCVILCAAVFLLVPLSLVVLDGIAGLAQLPRQVWQAAWVSVLVSLASTGIMVALALPIAIASSSRHRWLEAVALLGIAASPLVIGTGLFLIIYPIANPFSVAFPVTALVNAVMALPFALRMLIGPVRDVVQDYGRLSGSLDIKGWAWMRLVLLPRVRGALGFSCGLTAALSMGDLGVIALFADPERATLPLQMYRLMGSYRMEAASGAALLLLCLSFGLFWAFDRGGRGHAEA